MSDNQEGSMTVVWLGNPCEACRSKVPLLEELRRETGDRFRMLAVSLLVDDAALSPEIPRSAAFPSRRPQRPS